MASDTPFGMGMPLPGWLRAALESSVGKRVQRILRSQLQQIPCLSTALTSNRCLKRNQYQSLGQDEDDDGTEADDSRQHFNKIFGRTLVKVSMLCMVGITVMIMVRTGPLQEANKPMGSLTADEEFKRDSPVVLYLAAVELLVCGACSHTAALMYKRRKHALRHPSESTGRERERYTKVHLEKEAGKEEDQLYGLCFRPSTDGLECLIVEAIRKDSLLDKWNSRAMDLSPEEVLEEALGESSSQASPRPRQRVLPGAVILAVNDVTGDVGMMQLQLAKPKVTLWVRTDILDILHPSQVEPGPELYQRSGSAAGTAAAGVASSPEAGQPAPTAMGRAEEPGWSLSPAGRAPGGPLCACIAFEDEEPQIFTRWTVCGLIFGWITMLPVLLMQPHEERPRQQLFRQYLLKPCLLVLPVAVFLWCLDTIEVMFSFEVVRPLFYFGICHMVVPAVLMFYLMQLQAADEKLVLDQRKSRLAEAGCTVPVVVEDPAPMLIRELVTANPVALVWLSACAAIPVVVSSMLTPMQTERGRMAQGYLNLIYAPCVFLQVAFGYIIYRLRFIELPRFYLEGIGMLLSLPCFLVWSACLFCSSHYSRKDVALVEKQRLDRAKEALKKKPYGLGESSEQNPVELVDVTEAMNKEWELVFSA